MLKIKLLSPSYKLQVSLSEKKTGTPDLEKVKVLGPPGATQNSKVFQVHMPLPILN